MRLGGRRQLLGRTDSTRGNKSASRKRDWSRDALDADGTALSGQDGLPLDERGGSGRGSLRFRKRRGGWEEWFRLGDDNRLQLRLWGSNEGRGICGKGVREGFLNAAGGDGEGGDEHVELSGREAVDGGRRVGGFAVVQADLEHARLRKAVPRPRGV